jgi:hypothetical protein
MLETERERMGELFRKAFLPILQFGLFLGDFRLFVYFLSTFYFKKSMQDFKSKV